MDPLSSSSPPPPPPNIPNVQTPAQTAVRQKICGHCKKDNPEAVLCGRCKLVYYCNKECQRPAWKAHKLVCTKPEVSRITVTARSLDGTETKKTVSHKIWQQSQTEAGPTRDTFALSGSKGKKALSEVGPGMFKSFEVQADVVSFSTKNSPAFVGGLKRKGYNGLGNEDIIGKLIEDQDYVEVLKYVWTESDLSKKVEWLKARAREGHVILMLELSSAIFFQRPLTDEQIVEAGEWFFRGLYCTQLDIACNNDLSTAATVEMLAGIYMPGDKVPEQKLGLLNSINRKKVLEEWIPDAAHPSPRWVIYHGMSCQMGRDTMKAPSLWLECRQKKREDLLAR